MYRIVLLSVPAKQHPHRTGRKREVGDPSAARREPSPGNGTEDQAMCVACAELAEQHSITELGKSDNPPTTFHYSFDFAQPLQYPAQSSATWPHLLQDPSEDAVLRRARWRDFTPNELP